MEDQAAEVSASDRMNILELYATSYHALDFGRVDEWVATFIEEGVFERKVPSDRSKEIRVAGSEELRAFAREVCEERADRFRHWMTNAVFTATPEGVEAESYVAFIEVKGSARPRLLLTGTYRDLVLPTPNGWRFAHRRVTVDG